MSYNECKVLDLSEKLLDKIIKETIMGFDNMSSEEKCILLEEYSEKYKELYHITLENVERQREI